MAHIFGKMDQNIKGNLLMGLKMAMVSILMLMELYFKGFGKMVNVMVKVL